MIDRAIIIRPIYGVHWVSHRDKITAHIVLASPLHRNCLLTVLICWLRSTLAPKVDETDGIPKDLELK